jgi:predicted patatin/cPLA2 family phospholipase
MTDNNRCTLMVSQVSRMKIDQYYSHLNGLEFLLVHKPELWKEIKDVIAAVDADKCKTKISKEKRMKGKRLYSPKSMNASFGNYLRQCAWQESRISY